jgi:hypothetical protein
VEGEVVALDLRTQSYLGINRVGSAIWVLLDAGATEEQLVDAVLARFDVDAPRAAQDVQAFLDELAARDLVERL